MRLVAVGDNVVDCYPRLGLMFPGGNSLGVAVHAGRSGVPSAFVGAVGDDEPGRLVRTALAAERVDTDRLRVLPGPTAIATVDVVGGERVFVGNDKGVSLIDLDDADLDYLASFDVAHTSCYSRLEARVPAVARRLPLSYDFSHRTEPRYAGPLLGHLFLATFSGGELSYEHAADLARWAHREGARYVLVTGGPRGAVLYDGRRSHRQPALRAAVTDTLGAGDSFIARTLVGLVGRTETAPETLAAAARVATQACGHPGSFGYGAALPPELRLPDRVVDVSRHFLHR
jgi:fructoselysine 6-kinase